MQCNQEKEGKQLVAACLRPGCALESHAFFHLDSVRSVSNLELEVHEEDIIGHYDILKPYLLQFAGERLPSNQDHQALMALHCLSQPSLLILWFPTAFQVDSPAIWRRPWPMWR